MTGRATGEDLTSKYYINQMFDKEVKALTSRSQLTGGTTERKLFSLKKDG